MQVASLAYMLPHLQSTSHVYQNGQQLRHSPYIVQLWDHKEGLNIGVYIDKFHFDSPKTKTEVNIAWSIPAIALAKGITSSKCSLNQFM